MRTIVEEKENNLKIKVNKDLLAIFRKKYVRPTPHYLK